MKEIDLWDEFAHFFFGAFQKLWQPRNEMIAWKLGVWKKAIAEQQRIGNTFVEGWTIDDWDCFPLKRLWYSGNRHKLFCWKNAQVGGLILPTLSETHFERLLAGEKPNPSEVVLEAYQRSATIHALVQSYLSQLKQAA